VENIQEKGPTQRSLNKFEVLKDKIMNIGKCSEKKIKKDKKTILREERAKKEKSVKV